eukprot:TRINITY_DN20449_c0_g1_i1.p1 TRINITY_DN20449_c0_g1~~TRINITY_DN20449_c0_g1_i1.p1  ORF type:complete len:445 (-),score=61.39 TRINITY_DN20449_c0_g1_i1:50-1384(-)
MAALGAGGLEPRGSAKRGDSPAGDAAPSSQLSLGADRPRDPHPMWKRSAAFAMQVAPGSLVGFWGSSVGFYTHGFQCRSFFIGMMLVLWSPYPFVAALQEKYDIYFDEWFSTRNTYYFRTVALQGALAVIASSWLFLPQTPFHILTHGFLMGITASAILSSSMQLISAMDPVLVAYATMGEQAGKLTPVIAYSMSSFHPDASLAMFRAISSPAVAVCFLSGCYLSYLHFSTNVFEKAYRRLSYDLSTETFNRQDTETRPLVESEAESGRIPRWVIMWSSTMGLMMGMASFLWATCSFVGSPKLAQTLSLWKLAMDVFGQACSIAAPSLPGFYDGPWHVSFTCSFLLCFACFAVHAAGLLLNWHIPEPMFLPSWCLFNFLCNFNTPWVRMTTGLYVPVADRKQVSRTCSLIAFSGGLSGALFALLVATQKTDLSDWPSSDAVIKD